MLRIDQDLGRFRDIVKGRVRRELRRYLSSGELVGRQGGRTVSVPLPQIGIPRLRYGDNQGGGEGAGPGQGQGGAGEEAGEHALEVELTVEELTLILGEELELPRIEPKGAQQTRVARTRYTSIASRGPESLRHTRRTYRTALKRQLASGEYDPRRPRVIPIRDDHRYRHGRPEPEPHAAAAIVYIMDVSGSMGDEQKEIVRSEAFWIDAWIRHHYDDVQTRFIIHDARAREVDRDTFFRTKESGGTLISSAYTLVCDLIARELPADAWNTYVFQFSDGDNWSAADTKTCLGLLTDRLLPAVNLFGYAQVESRYGSGRFLVDLQDAVGADERVVLSRVPDRDHILDSIKDLLGTGR